MSPRYTLKEKPNDIIREELKQYDEFTQDVLFARNITTHKEAEAFFNPNYDTDTHDPFLLTDMEEAVTRLIRAIDDNEHIGVYTDFDADGIPAGALLHDALLKCGHEEFTNYIPHRDTEGYGFHTGAVDALKKKGVTLILTADVGISDIETVAYARTHDIDVIITDHHVPHKTLPDAIAVINPQRVDDFYPNIHLCGSGVAYKLVQALLLRAREEKKEWVESIPEGWEKWLLDLVAIATVADMMPLVGENRTLVHYGLFVLKKTPRPGLVTLCKKLGVQKQFITEDDIGFSIGPRINASSRMGEPETAFELLTTQDEARAKELAKELDALNNKRKGNVASIVRELNKRFKDDHDQPVLVAGNPKWNPALLGLAANSLVDTYGKTVCLWGREGTGNIKGSCRGVGDVHIVDMFRGVADKLTQFGGHEHAGGFGVAHDAVHSLQDILNEGYSKAQTNTEDDMIRVDADLPFENLQRTQRTLAQFAPFGIDNPKPLFLCRDASVEGVRQFGSDELHIEVLLAKDEFSPKVRAIAFFKNADSFSVKPVEGRKANCVCSLELSRFGGRVSLELRIVDIV